MARAVGGHRRDELIGAWLRPATLAALLFTYASFGVLRKMPPISLWVSALLIAALVAWSLWRFAGRRGPIVSPLHAPLLVYVAATGVSALLSTDRRASLDGLFFVATLAFIYILACEVLANAWQPRTMVRALMLLIAAVMVQAGGAIVAWYREWLSLRVPGYPLVPVEFRVFGVADWPTQLAGLINLGLPFALVGLLADDGGRMTRVASAIWLALADVVLVYTSSRGGWVGSAIAISVVIAWLSARDGLPPRSGWLRWLWARRRLYLTLVPYVAVFVVLVYLNKESVPSDYSTNAGPVLSGAGRLAFWRVAWECFLSRPITGVGPLTYAQHYVASIPTAGVGWVSPHAHNIVLNILAEQGVLGVIAGGWVLVRAFRTWWRAARPAILRPDAAHRPEAGLVIGAGAAFAACFAHCQVDILTRYPVTGVLLALLAAAVVSAGGEARRLRAGRHVWALAAGLLLGVAMFVVLARSNRAHSEYLDAVISAGNGDWAEAATHLDAAVALDPEDGVYAEQRAYAYGVLASVGHPAPGDARAEAIREYRRALAMQPPWVPNLLNAAHLLEQQGDRAGSRELLAAAYHRGDWNWPLAGLLYAGALAEEGDAARARAIVAEVLERSPAMADTAACRRDAICWELAPAAAGSQSPVVAACEEAAAQTALGRPDEALHILDGVSIGNRSSAPWIGRAEAHLALGERTEAGYALEMAGVLGQTAMGVDPDYARARAAWLVGEGRIEEAVAILEGAVRPELMVTRYHITTFGRVALPGLLLPDLDALQSTPANLRALAALAELYALQGRPADASWARERGEALAALLEPSGG